MTGTTKLTARQWATIQRSIDETSSPVTTIVLHPDYERGYNARSGFYTVRVVFSISGYGTVHFAVTAEGKRIPVNAEGAQELLAVTGIALEEGA